MQQFIKPLELADKLWKWKPHSQGQADWIECDAKVKVAACGRRWGKSESTAVDIALYSLMHPGHIQILVAPTEDQTSIIMGDVERRLFAIPGMNKCLTYRASPYKEILFKDGGGLWTPTIIMARTAGTTGKGLRGRKAHRVIVDEAAFVSDNVMDTVITPLLADYDGQRVEVSSPAGRNHFYKDWKRGQEANQVAYRSFRFPSSSNPLLPRGYLKREQATKPERAWQQEYEAAFLDSDGAVFRKVEQSMIARPQTCAQKGHQYIFGVDWARSRDYTVIVVIDITTREMVAIDRFSQVSYTLQRDRLKALAQRFLPVSIVAEANSMGGPNIEKLQEEGLPVYAFTTTNASKDTIIQALTLALETGAIRLLADDVLKHELLAYEGKKMPSGLMTYSAPEGEHDDTVIATCLATWGLAEENSAGEWFLS